MERPGSHEVPVQFMSSTPSDLGAKEAGSYQFKDISNQHVVFSAQNNDDYPLALPLFRSLLCQGSSDSNVKLLSESSTILQGVPQRDIPNGILFPLGNLDNAKEVFESQRVILGYDSKVAIDCCTSGPSVDRNSSKVSSSHMPNNNNHEDPVDLPKVSCSNQIEISDGEDHNIPAIRYLRKCIEGDPGNNSTSTENQNSMTQELHEDYCNVSQPHRTVTVAVPGFPSRQCNRESRQRANVTDRLRRARISERLNAFRELLPHFEQGSRASLLDDVIDYIKYLQLQIKGLSQSRLRTEAASDPFVHFEGYGHYLLHQQMINEPLEEMIGKLMEDNPLAANRLLESKGLYVMPTNLAAGLSQSRELCRTPFC